MTDRWNCPFQGLGYFFTKPRLWGWAFLGIFIAGLFTLFICAKVIAATYPHYASFWPILRSLGWGAFAFVLMVLFIFPIIFNACFAKALANLLKREGHSVRSSFWSSFFSSVWVFIRTLKWRILWPLILLLTILMLPILVFPVSLMAANHLAVLESVDLVLSIFGVDANGRVRWIETRGRDCLAVALSGSLLTFLLSFFVIGWLFWIPAIYCGVFLWIRPEFIKPHS